MIPLAALIVAVAALAASMLGCSASSSSKATVCEDDHCVCARDEPCSHDCAPGGLACEVQCGPAEPCEVGCAAGERCHVECSQTSACDVDCGDSPECHVTCPATGCTVHNCVGARCTVACGIAALPTRNGPTATCP